MKVILKTITGKQHEFDVDASFTTLDVKKLLEEDYEPTSLRLCFNGCVLEDNNTLASAKVKDGDSIVLAGRKRKIPKPAGGEPAVDKTAPSESAPTSSSVAASPSTPPPPPLAEAISAVTETSVLATAPVVGAEPSAAENREESAVPGFGAAPAASTHDVAANLIDEVASMGFEDREQIALALRAAFMNVERAVEYLCDGIPPYLVEELTRQRPTAGAPSAAGHSGVPATGSTSASGASLATPSAAASAMRASLARIPQFDEIRALYNENRETLPVIMQQIAVRHPAVYEQIERDPEGFLSVMGETGEPGDTRPLVSSGPQSTAGAAAAANAEESFTDQLPASLELTAEDRLAVQQLVELGGGMWDEQSAVLVYLATQRNHEVAASVLFEHGGVPAELLAAIANQMIDEEGEEDPES